jgi:protein-S-isoprenylcysteine O-methyltransferase Ste14
MGTAVVLAFSWIIAVSTSTRAKVPAWPVYPLIAMFILGATLYRRASRRLGRSVLVLEPSTVQVKPLGYSPPIGVLRHPCAGTGSRRFAKLRGAFAFDGIRARIF